LRNPWETVRDGMLCFFQIVNMFSGKYSELCDISVFTNEVNENIGVIGSDSFKDNMKLISKKSSIERDMWDSFQHDTEEKYQKLLRVDGLLTSNHSLLPNSERIY
jgi:hypothetical protein